jgi:SAM-dependent methyltransferase
MASALPDAPLLSRVSQEIHPRCEMYDYARGLHGEQEARAYYFSSSLHLIEHLQRFLTAEGLRPAELSLLDFAAGYGRFTRFFVHLFREVAVSDLDPEMLAFAERCFGVPGYLSDTDPRRLRIDRRFDVVFCFSLFTHLPKDSWIGWLRRLAELVEPGGLLLFSTRSPALARALGAPDLQPVQVGGTPQAGVSTPGRPVRRRELSLHGLRLSAAADTAGTILLRIGVSSAKPWWVEAPRVLDEAPAPGLRIGPAAAEPLGAAGAWDALELRIPFSTAARVDDAPLGGIVATLRSLEPARVDLAPPEVRVEGTAEDGKPWVVPWLGRALDDSGSGFAFQATNETAGRLDTASYGSTTVSDEWVRRTAESLGMLELVGHFARGEFDLFQDVYAFRCR